MNDFAWTSPTQFVFGRDAEEKIGPWAASAGARRALLVFGQGHVVRSGLLARVKASLEGAGVTCIEHGGVRPNPEIALVRDGVAAAREAEVDLIVPIGGGSAIDTAKAIACGAVYDGDAWDFFRRPNPVQPTDALPIAAVLTIPAAGSEASNSCVIQNDAEHAKRGMNADLFRPRAAFMNPELTMTLPTWQTFSGVTDMCAHIFERFFSSTGSVAMTDNLALAALRTIRTEALHLMRDPDNYDARATIMWASTLAHNGLFGVGRDEDWASHGLEHELSAAHPEITHGAGLAVMFPAWMRHVCHVNPARFVLLGREVFGLVPTGYDLADAMSAIDCVQEFFCSLGMPRTLDEFNMTKDEVDGLVESIKLSKGERFGSFMQLTPEDVREIYLSAFKD